MPQSPLPYALSAPVFPFRHLAALAGRAPIGGAREVALACFMAARLAAEVIHSAGADGETRAARSTAARTWLGALTLPAAVRGALTRCIESTAAGGAQTVGREVAGLAAASTSYLDPSSRAELKQLAESLAHHL